MGAALAPIMLATAIGGAGLSAAGAYSSAEAQASNANYQAQVAANNAAVAKQNATLDTAAGVTQSGNQELKTRAAVGTTKAGQAASGVDVNSGSFPAVRSSESELGMLDAMTIRSNAAKEAYSQQVAATGDTAESTLLSSEASQAKAAAPISALGTFLGQASSAGGKFAQYGTVASNAGSSISDTAIY
jgi:hypothetical protein